MCPSRKRLAEVALRGEAAATKVTLVGATFEEIGRGLQQLKARVPAGVYEARFELGGAVARHPFKVVAGERKEIIGPPQVTVSLAPLARTGLRGSAGLRRTRAADLERLGHMVEKHRPRAREGVLQVILRSGGGSTPRRPPDIFAAGRPVSWRKIPGAWIGSVALEQGFHRLAMSSGGTDLCRTIPVAAGQQSMLSMQVPPHGAFVHRLTAALLEASLLISPYPISLDDQALLLQEMAQQALQRGRPLMGPADFDGRASLSPLALLLGAHGLIEASRARMEHPLDPVSLDPADVTAVESAYRQLRGTWMAGSADLAALALAVGKRPPPVSLELPPLLVSTWHTLTSASLASRGIVRGGAVALRAAQGLVASALWMVWIEPMAAGTSKRSSQHLTVAARALLEPHLRPSAGRLPSWVESRGFGELASARAPALARALDVPVPLVLQLARDVDAAHAKSRRARASARLAALARPNARICLVALPEGVREDPIRGQPIDFEALFDGALDDLISGPDLVAVRAPPVGLHSEEMQAAIAEADLVVADLTFGDARVIGIAAAWLARGHAGDRRAERLIQIRAADYPAATGLSEEPPFPYTTTFGTDASFLDSGAFQRAVSRAAGACDRTGRLGRRRAGWLKAQAITVRRHRELRELGQRARKVRAARGRSAAQRLLRQSFPPKKFRSEPAAVQLEAFLLFRAFSDWKSMRRAEPELSPALRKTALVREQLAAALNRIGGPGASERALQLLESVVAEIGPNGETCGLLGSVWKERWRGARADRPDTARHLDEAIRWYRWGMQSSPLDPYPGVNVLTLLAIKGTTSALAEHDELLPQVERAAWRRLQARPGFWDLVTMMQIAVNKRDLRGCERYMRMAINAPHEEWQRATASATLDDLQKSRARSYQELAGRLAPLIRSFKRGTFRDRH